jgi:hypothetical protein
MFCDECGIESGNCKDLVNILGIHTLVCQDCLFSKYDRVEGMEDTWDKKINYLGIDL